MAEEPTTATEHSYKGQSGPGHIKEATARKGEKWRSLSLRKSLTVRKTTR